MEINWNSLPYSHKWEKSIPSIFNSEEKITFPQFIMEMVLYNREQYWKKFPKLPRGKGWSNSVQTQVRNLVQQASVIANYFPHINDDPLVMVSFRNFFRNFRVGTIGRFTKYRVSKNGNRESLNITQAEKDVVLGIMSEFNRLKEQREIFSKASSKETKPKTESVKFNTHTPNRNKKTLSSLMELEQQLKKDR